MTEPQPTDREIELERLLEELRTAMEAREEEFRVGYEHQQQLLQSRPTQDVIDAVTAERNTARLELSDLRQEFDRLRTLLQEIVTGVTTWVPDLTPVPTPPANIPSELHQAWIRDQIATRRQEWDTFVNRVVTQATV